MTEDGSIDYDAVAETYAQEQTLPDTNLKKYMVVRIELNPDAKWSDGEPVTVGFCLCKTQFLMLLSGARRGKRHVRGKTGRLPGISIRSGLMA